MPIKVVKRISGLLDGFTGRAGAWCRGLTRIGAGRLRQLRGSGNLTAALGRLAASRLKVTERTVRR